MKYYSEKLSGKKRISKNISAAGLENRNVEKKIMLGK